MLCDRGIFAQKSDRVSAFSEQSGHAVLFFTGNLPLQCHQIRGCIMDPAGLVSAGAGLALCDLWQTEIP